LFTKKKVVILKCNKFFFAEELAKLVKKMKAEGWLYDKTDPVHLGNLANNIRYTIIFKMGMVI